MKANLIVIENEADHRAALSLIDRLMASDDAVDRVRMTAQAKLVEAYEKSRWPRHASSLPEVLTHLLDQHGLTRAGLIPLLDTASRVSEVLNGKRELSMSMVKRLRERFHISAEKSAHRAVA